MRELACRVILHLEMKEAVSLLIPLLDDVSVNVKCAALETFGFFRLPYQELVAAKFKSLSEHSHPRVAITASWALSLAMPDAGFDLLEKWMHSRNLDNRLLAASAMSSTGQFGTHYWGHFSSFKNDPYLQSNLALGSVVKRGQCREFLRGAS